MKKNSFKYLIILILLLMPAAVYAKCSFCFSSEESGYSYGGRSCCESCYYKKTGHKSMVCLDCGARVFSLDSKKNAGYPQCASCAAEGISDKQSLDEVSRQAKLYLKNECAVDLIFDESDLFFSYPGSGNVVFGRCKTEKKFRGGVCIGSKSTVYVIKGMSRSRLFFVLCHEYAHVWHNSVNVNSKSVISGADSFKEAFASWAAYKCLCAAGYGFRTGLYIQRDIYSSGLNKMLELEKKLGSEEALIEYVKSNTVFI